MREIPALWRVGWRKDMYFVTLSCVPLVGILQRMRMRKLEIPAAAFRG